MATLPAATAAYRYDAVADPTYPALTAELDHAALDNLNSTTHTHLTAANHTDLTDGGSTTLHTHDAKADASQPSWVAIQDAGSGDGKFQNSWVNAAGEETAAYRKSTTNRVELKGVIGSGSVGNYAAFTLPAGYRPASSQYLPIASNGAFGLVYITTAGEVKIFVGSNVYASLQGVSFWV